VSKKSINKDHHKAKRSLKNYQKKRMPQGSDREHVEIAEKEEPFNK